MIFAGLLFLSLAAFAWLAFSRPHVALPLFFALLPTYLLRFSLGPLPTTFLEGCFWMLFAGFLWRERAVVLRDVRSRNFLLGVGAFFTLSAASLLVVPREHLVSSVGLWRAYLLEPALLFFMLRYAFTDARVALQSFLSMAMSAFVLAVVGIFQYRTGLGIPAPWDVELRITSVFDYPNALGLFLAPVLSALLVFAALTWKSRALYQRVFLTGVSCALAAGIVLAKTEAALVAVPASLFFFLLLSPAFSRKQKITSVALAILGLAAACSFTPVREKLLLQDYSGGVRLSQWRETAQLLADHPIAGAGFGYYPVLLRSYHADWQFEIFQYPHNILLNVWVELGALGVCSAALVFVLLAKRVWERRHEPLVLAAGIAILSMCIHGLVDVPFFKNDLAMMTVFFAGIVFSKKR